MILFARDTAALLLALALAAPLALQPSRAGAGAGVPHQPEARAPASAPGPSLPEQAALEPGPEPLVAEFRAALARSPWPPHLHHDLEAIAVCESRLDPHQVGDGGLAFGWLQIRADYHAVLAARYRLLDGPQNLEAGWAIYEAAGGSFWPWSCWRAGVPG